MSYMMKNFKTLTHFFTLLFVVFEACCSNAVAVGALKKICPKILFKNINEYDMPWIQVEGVYEDFSTKEGFPVYSNRDNSLFLYYNHDTTTGIKSLKFGETVREVFGLLGQLPADFNPETWLNSGNVNKNDVFGNVVKSWKYYSPLEKTFKSVSNEPKAVCVDDDVFKCSSGKVFLNDLITGTHSSVLNDPKTDFFSKLEGVYLGIRSVFKHSKQNWYLYYRNDFWRIGTSYSSATINEILRVRDMAWRPEFITERWEKWTGTKWINTEDDIRVLCRGIANGENQCQGRYTCKNDASCVHTKANETLCICPNSAYGPYCERTDKCSNPKILTSAVTVSWRGTRPGDIATLFCSTGYRTLPMQFYVCYKETGATIKHWYLVSKASCQDHRPTIAPKTRTSFTPWVYSTRSQTTKKHWDKSLDFVIFFGPCLVFQVLLPVFIWFGLTIAGLFRACKITQARTDERLELVGKVQDGKYRKLLAVYSAFFNLAFWVWLGFVLACAVTDYHKVHEYLFYCALGMTFFCAVFVIIEAFTCPERIALQNIVTWEYIKHLHSVPPVLEMQVERYDEKIIQEGGLHTNPTTGRLEYRNEIRRKVGKKIVRESFVFTSWNDTSNRENSFGRGLTRVHLNLVIKFGGETTKQSYEAQKENLIQKTNHLNLLYEFSRHDKVPGLHPFVTMCCDRQSVSSWIQEKYFWYATCLQLSWLYRLAFNYTTKFAEYTVRKNVFDDCQTRDTGDNQFNLPGGDQSPDQFPVHIQCHENTSLIEQDNQQQKQYMTI